MVLFQARLDKANLKSACLQGVNLKEASCVRANFRHANLGRDNLGGGTRFQGADLSRTHLNQIVLEGAEHDDSTKFPKGFHPTSRGMIDKETKFAV